VRPATEVAKFTRDDGKPPGILVVVPMVAVAAMIAADRRKD
jgi:hypothetical protein